MGKTKNNLADLNEYLFGCLDSITNGDLDEEELEKELKRSDMVAKVARTVIDNGNLMLQAKKTLCEYGVGDKMDIGLLGVKEE